MALALTLTVTPIGNLPSAFTSVACSACLEKQKLTVFFFVDATPATAESRFESEQYTSDAFIESAGAVLFHLSSREICVLHLLKRDEYVLAKGRRNCGEASQATALRELSEETGFTCRLLPLNMHTRCPLAVETEQLVDDQARFYLGICEPFTLQVRRLGEGQIKLIWWFVAAVDEEVVPPKEAPEEGERERYSVEFYSYAEGLDKLTFRVDREMVKKAIELVGAHTK